MVCGQRQIKAWQILPTVQRHLQLKGSVSLYLVPPWAGIPGSSAVPAGRGEAGMLKVWFAHCLRQAGQLGVASETEASRSLFSNVLTSPLLPIIARVN